MQGAIGNTALQTLGAARVQREIARTKKRIVECASMTIWCGQQQATAKVAEYAAAGFDAARHLAWLRAA